MQKHNDDDIKHFYDEISEKIIILTINRSFYWTIIFELKKFNENKNEKKLLEMSDNNEISSSKLQIKKSDEMSVWEMTFWNRIFIDNVYPVDRQAYVLNPL